DSGAGHVPDTVAIGRYHVERVAAGRKIGEIRHTARARINPVSIQRFEFVFELILVSLDVAEPGVTDLQTTLTWLNSNAVLKINCIALESDRVNQHRWSLRIDVYGLRINYYYAFLCRKPEFSIASHDSRRFPPTVALEVEHAVAFSVCDAVDPRDFATGEVVQLLLADTIDALVTTDPEVSMTIFADMKGAVVE